MDVAEEKKEKPEASGNRLDKGNFRKMSDDECRQLIKDAKEGLIDPSEM